MKKQLLILTIGLMAIMACKPTSAPEDVAGVKKLLAEKKSTLKALQIEIDSLEAQLEVLEPSKVKTSLVTIDTIKKETLDRYALLQGSVMSDEMVNASSEIAGRIINVRVKEGDNVRKGQLIATIDTEILDKQMQELRTRLDLATTVFEKQKSLWEKNIGSEIQYLQAKNNKESLEKSMETLQFQMSKRNVYAPVTGTVDREILKAGEMASPGMPIVTILNTSKLKIVADVPETYLTNVKRGDKVKVYFPALDKEIEKRITLIGRSIDPSNRTFKIEMDTDNMGGTLKPNLLAEVKINDLTIKDAIAISTELIQEDVDGAKYVFVAEPGGEYLKAKKVYVETGEVADRVIEVKSGINTGDLLIDKGARTIIEGDNLIDENAKN